MQNGIIKHLDRAKKEEIVELRKAKVRWEDITKMVNDEGYRNRYGRPFHMQDLGPLMVKEYPNLRVNKPRGTGRRALMKKALEQKALEARSLSVKAHLAPELGLEKIDTAQSLIKRVLKSKISNKGEVITALSKNL